MAEQGRRLLSSIVKHRDASSAMRSGVTAEMFRDDQQASVWRFIRDGLAESGVVPSPGAVRLEFPTFELVSVTDDPQLVLDQFLRWHRDLATYRIVEGLVGLVQQGRYDDALDEMTGAAAALQSTRSETSDVDLADTREERRAQYMEPANEDGMLGMPTGFATIDQATAGLQGGQLVTLIASPKSGKSIVALKMAHHLNTNGASVLFHGFEMSNTEQQVRYDAIAAGISSDRLRRRCLRPDEAKRLNSHLDQDLPAAFVLSDSSGPVTVPALSAAIAEKESRPDVIFIDGAYFLVDEATGEANTARSLTNITRALKRLAQRLDVPIVITTQTLLWKMKGVKLEAGSIGYSSSFLQDSDVVLGLERDEENDGIRNLRVIESRNCGPVETVIQWDWETSTFEETEVEELDFSQFDAGLYAD